MVRIEQGKVNLSPRTNYGPANIILFIPVALKMLH
jgi:hypothetical protein